MNIIVRFNWQHDLDLAALNQHPDYRMGQMMKAAVKAAARGDQEFTIPIPDSFPHPVRIEDGYCHFRLSTDKDADVIDYLKNIRYGFRNSALKQIFRLYMERALTEVFYDTDTFIVKTRGKKPEDRVQKSSTKNTSQKKKKAFSVPHGSAEGTAVASTFENHSVYKDDLKKERNMPSSPVSNAARQEENLIRNEEEAVVTTGMNREPVPPKQEAISNTGSSTQTVMPANAHTQVSWTESEVGTVSDHIPMQSSTANYTRMEHPVNEPDVNEDIPDDGFDFFGAMDKLMK